MPIVVSERQNRIRAKIGKAGNRFSDPRDAAYEKFTRFLQYMAGTVPLPIHGKDKHIADSNSVRLRHQSPHCLFRCGFTRVIVTMSH